MIDFGHSLNTAWERTRIILFHGDGAKWCVIGFNAFLMIMGQGGVQLKNPIPFQNQNGSFQQQFKTSEEAKDAMRQILLQMQTAFQSPWTLAVIGIGIVLLIAWVAMLWAGSRGEFMFLDNLVRNRAKIAEPWRRYARQGNVWFGVNLALVVFSLLLVFGGIATILAEVWSWIVNSKTPSGAEVGVVIATGVAFLVVWLVYAVIAFIFRTFVTPLYFTQAIPLGRCFSMVFGLMTRDPVGMFVYVAISFGLGIIQAILTILVMIPLCCVLCWASCLPFVGTVVVMFVICEAILPMLVFTRCFQLECLAQYGPEYDVWTVDVQPAPTSLPQQPG